MSEAPSIVLFDIGNVLIDWNPYVLFEELIPDAAERAHFHKVVCPRDWWVRHDAGASFEEIAAPVCERFPEHRDLKSRNVPVRALTNWAADKFQIALKEYDFLSWFEDVVVSGEVRMIKPDPAIFAMALDRMQTDANSVLFIDDSAPNIEAAAKLGFQTHHFKHPDGLLSDLVACGLL